MAQGEIKSDSLLDGSILEMYFQVRFCNQSLFCDKPRLAFVLGVMYLYLTHFRPYPQNGRE